MSDAAVTLDVLFHGVLPSPHGYVYRPDGNRVIRTLRGFGGGSVPLPCLSFVLRHPTAGVILVDTGFHPALVERGAADFGFPLRVIFRSVRPEPTAFDAQLRERGIDPGDVTQVVMTHLHGDHTSGMRLLPRAEFVVSADELRTARGRGAATKGFVAAHLPGDARFRVVDIGRDGVPFGPFAQSIDLLGDGSVRLLSTPGHTPGHLSVLVETADRGTVLLVGDAAYTRRNIDERILPLLTDSDGDARRSLDALHEYGRENPDVTVIPTHDPEAWRELVGHE
ncbi:MAG: N-acyl homoserine lactonase family protein [Patulibacter sp.]|nr:N-acyl homoserine lactonase family protein [Patulibacter sp.]